MKKFSTNATMLTSGQCQLFILPENMRKPEVLCFYLEVRGEGEWGEIIGVKLVKAEAAICLE